MDPNAAVSALAAVAIMVGIAGTVIPVLPGSLLVAAAALIWAALLHTPAVWILGITTAAIAVMGAILSNLIAGRRLMATGVPRRTLTVAGLGAVAGFFLIPVVGLPVGLVGGMYLAETARLGRIGGGHAAARRSTVAAIRALGVGLILEATCAAVAGSLWFAGVLFFGIGTT